MNKQQRSISEKLLYSIEKAANILPSPFTLFVILFFITSVVALFLNFLQVSVINPTTSQTININNLYSQDGLFWILKNLVSNFTGYAPLGLVLTMTLGIGLCEESGLVGVLLRKLMHGVPPILVPYAVAFIGIVGNIASDTASVIIPPLAGMVYLGANKNPIAGMITGFAATNAGFGANIFIAGTDALIAGITNTVLDGFLSNGYQVEVVCNWFFMCVSTFLLTLVIGAASSLIVEKRLVFIAHTKDIQKSISILEVRGLKFALIALIGYISIIVLGLTSGILLNQETGSILNSPFLSGLIPILFALFVVCGIAYGVGSGTIKGEKDISLMMTKRIALMSSYVVFVFSSAQFIELFNWTNIGTLIAVSGASFLENLGFTGIPMIMAFIILVSFINVVIGSGSAKWSLLAPVFVPMFMLLGYDPAFTQLVYRIGDSATNILSPMSAYLFMSIGIAQENYDKNVTMGTFISNLFPISMLVLLAWSMLLIVWMVFNLPLGPGSGIYLPFKII